MKRKARFFGQIWITFKTALKTYISENYIRYSAALSYYTIFSLAPMLIVTISLCGYVFGKQAMEGRIYTEIRTLVGDEAAIQIQSMIQRIVSAEGSLVAKAIGIIVIVLGILGIFSETQDSVNHIWNLKSRPARDWKNYLIKRSISFGIFSVTGFMVVLSLLLNWLIAVFGDYLIRLFPESGVYMIYAVNRVFIIAISATFFACLFKYLPDGKVKWRDTIRGALITSILFMLGKAAIGYYLVHSNVTSLYGAAGSLVALLLWIYYFSIIIFFGVTFTKEYAFLYGGKIIPKPYAVFIETNEIR